MGNDTSKGGGGGGGGQRRAPVARSPRQSRAVSSIAKIKQTIARQEKRKAFLEKKIKNELLQAKAKMKRKDKRGALMHMKRKQMYQKEIAKMEAVQMTLEQQCFNIESAQANV